MSVSSNIKTINENIVASCKKVNRNPDDVKIIGVTKYVNTDKAEELLNNGVVNLGENRAEELIEKYEALDNRAKFHFIGTLRSEEHTSELQSRGHLVCRLLLEKKKIK